MDTLLALVLTVVLSVQSEIPVTLRNPNGRSWTLPPSPSGYCVFVVPYQEGEWYLSNERCWPFVGPGRATACGLYITPLKDGTTGSWAVKAPTPTVTPAATPTPHDPTDGIRLAPAPPGYVWLVVFTEDHEGRRSVLVVELIQLEDLPWYPK